MPELPEIARLASQIQDQITGKTIAAVDVIQPKCINLPVDEFKAGLTGATFLHTRYKGKWVQSETSCGWLLVNLGMGGEVLLTSANSLPAKRRLVIGFTDGTCLAINFWWFGYVHFIAHTQLADHKMTARLGPNALDIKPEELAALLQHSHGTIKSILLDQSRIAGIGNAYIHDILFLAGLHPLHRIENLSHDEITGLHAAIQQSLKLSLDKGGAWYELDLFGKPGGFTKEDILVGYREGQACPRCGTAIEKLRTGATTSYICPACQQA